MSATAAPPLPLLCAGGCGFDGERQRTDAATGTAQWLCSFCDGDRVDTTTTSTTTHHTNATPGATRTTTAPSSIIIADDNAVARGEDEAIAAVSAVKEQQYRAFLSRTMGCAPEAVLYDAHDAVLVDAAHRRVAARQDDDDDVSLSGTGNWALVRTVTRSPVWAHETTATTALIFRVNPSPVQVVDRSTYRLEQVRSVDTNDCTRGVTVRWRTRDDAQAQAQAQAQTQAGAVNQVSTTAHDAHATQRAGATGAAAPPASGAAAMVAGATSSSVSGGDSSGLVSKASGARSYAWRDAHPHASVLEITDHSALPPAMTLLLHTDDAHGQGRAGAARPLVRFSAAFVVDPHTAALWTTALAQALPCVPVELRALILQTAFDM